MRKSVQLESQSLLIKADLQLILACFVLPDIAQDY